MNLSAIQTLAISVIVAIGLIVLMALKIVPVAQGLPPLALLTGVHIGVGITSPTTPTAAAAPASTTTSSLPIQ